MRKLLISLIAIAALGAGGAFAQSGFWAGISGGYPGAQVHFGVENVFPNLDVRGNLGFAYIGAPGVGTGIGLGVDVLYGLNVDTGLVPLDVYAGAGPNIAVGAAAVGFSIDAFVGAEYRLGELNLPEGGVFLELGPAIRVLPTFTAGLIGRLGFNWHF